MLLVEGVADCGAGHWNHIKSKYFYESDRTQGDLKDKYRNMTHPPPRASAEFPLPPPSSAAPER